MEPRDFDLQVYPGTSDPAQLRHKVSGNLLQIRGSADQCSLQYQAAPVEPEQPWGPTLVYDPPGWEGCHAVTQEWLELIQNWLADRADYQNTPDLWAALRLAEPEGVAAGSVPADNNTPFTDAERAEISNQLRAISASVQERFDLTTDQIAHLEAKLGEAEEASTRLGRKDWLTLFYGVILTLLIGGVLTPDVVQHVFTGVLQGLGHLFGMGGPPLILTMGLRP